MPAIAGKDEKCRLIEALIAGGKGVSESGREVGTSGTTFYRWCKAQSHSASTP